MLEGSTYVSCGHKVEDVDAGVPAIWKDKDRAGNPAYCQGELCPECYRLQKSFGDLLDSVEEAEEWLAEETYDAHCTYYLPRIVNAFFDRIDKDGDIKDADLSPLIDLMLKAEIGIVEYRESYGC